MLPRLTNGEKMISSLHTKNKKREREGSCTKVEVHNSLSLRKKIAVNALGIAASMHDSYKPKNIRNLSFGLGAKF